MDNRLRRWRTEAGLSQAAAAAKLGISRAVYSPVELGRLKPTPDVAQKLAAAFDETADDLLKPINLRLNVPVFREATPL